MNLADGNRGGLGVPRGGGWAIPFPAGAGLTYF
jgi:hypothetical protein